MIETQFQLLTFNPSHSHLTCPVLALEATLRSRALAMDLPYNLIHTASENDDYSKNRPGMTLNQRRKAALEEVDDAAFS